MKKYSLFIFLAVVLIAAGVYWFFFYVPKVKVLEVNKVEGHPGAGSIKYKAGDVIGEYTIGSPMQSVVINRKYHATILTGSDNTITIMVSDDKKTYSEQKVTI
jgi:hypothetical protein